MAGRVLHGFVASVVVVGIILIRRRSGGCSTVVTGEEQDSQQHRDQFTHIHFKKAMQLSGQLWLDSEPGLVPGGRFHHYS